MAKSRSPRKPSIDLERAVELATILHRQILNHSSAKETVLQHWGYSPKSSNGLVAFGALRQFGLIDQRRGQDAKLSPLALEIVLDERPDSPERDEAVCRAALNPILHQELWSKYAGKLPSDAEIKLYLQRDKSFTPKGAEDFISQFRATIAYANLDASGNGAEETSPEQREQDELIPSESSANRQPATPPRVPLEGVAQIDQATFPLDEGPAVLQWPADLSLASVEEFEAWLDLVKKKVRRASTARSRQPDTEDDRSSAD